MKFIVEISDSDLEEEFKYGKTDTQEWDELLEDYLVEAGFPTAKVKNRLGGDNDLQKAQS